MRIIGTFYLSISLKAYLFSFLLLHIFSLETSKLHIVTVTVLLPLLLMNESFGIWKLISLVIAVLQFEFTSCRVQLIINDIEIQELEHGRRRTKICVRVSCGSSMTCYLWRNCINDYIFEFLGVLRNFSVYSFFVRKLQPICKFVKFQFL
ncbi:hypothetical protein ABFX02_12G046700 [Erythranthe guttata]